MNWMKKSIVAFGLAAAAGLALAGPHHHHHYRSGPRVVVSASLGWPWLYAPYYSPYYSPVYTVPVVTQPVIVQSTPQVVTYVQRDQVEPAATPAAQPSAYWYYCRNPEGYYPYVKTCNDAWQPVAAQPAQ